MNFEEFKEAMKELKNKGYIGAKIYEDHIFVEIRSQREEELTDMIKKNIKKLSNKIEEGILHAEIANTIMFVSTEKMKYVFKTAKNYDEAVEILNSANISYISSSTTFRNGINKYIEVSFKEYCGLGGYPNFEDSIKKAIRKSMPSNVSCDISEYNFKIKFDEGIEYERRKNNCKELEIEEEFDKLFRKYE